MSAPTGIPPTEITVAIDRLVVETEHPVDAFAFRLALTHALQAVVEERGVPAGWTTDVRAPLAVIDGFEWDGQGAESCLASAVAARLYEGVHA
jgi:hypothetical protein